MVASIIFITKSFIIIILYWIAFYTFGGYVRFVHFTELCTSFICKEMDQLDPAYDYIVVGCGSAGSIVALRLAADKRTTVLVLEAGPNGGRYFDIPAVGPILQLSTIDWQYRTVPQKNASKAFDGQINSWPMGRIVGGTGRLNNMIYVRGHPNDFKQWYKDAKNFNYEADILTYFKKSENQRGFYSNDTKFHSAHGPLLVEDLNFETPLAEAFLKAVAELGYHVGDLNGEYNTGFMKTQVNTNFGSRWTPAHNLFNNYKQHTSNHKHHLPDQKSNLVIQTNTHVNKVLLKSGYEAYGVEYWYVGGKQTVLARKGVILSAGVIGTPKILMLSGIGPDDHLTELGIKTKIDLPVGDNLQDHVTTGSDLVLLNTSMGIDIATVLNPIAGYNYLFNSSGPWTVTGAEVVGILNTHNSSTCSENGGGNFPAVCEENQVLDVDAVPEENKFEENKVQEEPNDAEDSTSSASTEEIKLKVNVATKYLPKAQRYKTSNAPTEKDDATRPESPSAKNHEVALSQVQQHLASDPEHTKLPAKDGEHLRKPTSEDADSDSPNICEVPDLGFMIVPGGASTDHGGHTKRASGLSDKAWNDYFVPLMIENPITILPIVLHPKSKGTVRLLDKNPYSYPLIDPNYLSDPNDVATLLKGIEIIKKIIAANAMQQFGAKLNTRKFPGCEELEFDTKPYWECYVRHLTITSYHPVGTCKMGSSKDKESVVDYTFQVHGTNKLYVADASVIPYPTSGNPNAAIVMIGEKAADEIKNHNFLITRRCFKREIFIRKTVCRIRERACFLCHRM